jgi:hypothetical protein
VGLAASALTFVHPRGYAVDVAVLVVAGLLLRPWRTHAVEGLSLVAGLLLGFGLLRVALVATRATNVIPRSDYTAGAVLGRNASGHAVGSIAIGVVGRLFYLTLATVGLAPLVLALGVVGLVAVLRGDTATRQVVRALTGTAVLGVTALSVVLVNGGSRTDQLIHGRYVDGLAVPVIVLGLAEVVVDRGRRWLAWLVTGVGVLGVTGAALAVWGHAGSLNAPLNAINVVGIEPVLRRLSHERLEMGPLLLVGAGAIAVVALLARHRPLAAALLIGVAFAASALDTQRSYLVPGSAAKERQTVLAQTVTAASSDLGVGHTCVSYDGDFDFNYFADRLLLDTLPLHDMPPGGHPCGPFVITARPDFGGRFPGSRLVLDEDDIDEDLYVLPGPAQARLGAAGWLLPPVIPGPVPLTGQTARIVTRAPAALSVRSGAHRSVRAKVTNASRVSPWPAELALKQGPYAVRVAVRWFATGSAPSSPGEPGTPVVTTTVELPRSLVPGHSASLRIPLVARLATGAPLPPASYLVRIAVYQELHGSFAGAITLRVEVTS